MKLLILIPLLLVLFFFTLPSSDAHRDGCHRWHSCPSDSGSYICGDLGYYSECPSYSIPKSEPEAPKYVQPPIPSWIKNVAGWWVSDTIDDKLFIEAIQFLIKEDIIKTPPTPSGSNGDSNIPPWVKNNAGWWAEGVVDDDSFIRGITFLIKEGIIQVN